MTSGSSQLTPDGKYIIKNGRLYSHQGFPVAGFDDKYGLTKKDNSSPNNSNSNKSNNKSDSSNNSDSNSKKAGETKPTNGKRYNLTRTSSEYTPVLTATEEVHARKNGKAGYIYFTDDQVKQIEDRLWEDIQNYRVSKGYPRYKRNAELDKLAYNSLLPGTPEWERLAKRASLETQNVQTVGQYTPGLVKLGMNMSMGLIHKSLFSDVNGAYLNNQERNPIKVADAIFNTVKESDTIWHYFFEGDKEQHAYGALSVRYFVGRSNGTQTDRQYYAVGFSFFNVDGTSPEWIGAWNKE
ncbi:hypothetical protein FC52_GL001767 [Lactobacillus pasteurii DSM 23907 = CRBIP 24.76]|uniref:N-acetylmuramidase n=1 Tax=Lactobacillus pasteurii DSM 23907 = CRBIP 24.76 TaxID=1423790 RepID=I7IYZ4_9LACO|nr:hypothetical protein [Lactobacillus pasteurii]KRK07494.1 hypothetical protein FC52_GL001767 [Lactobacillus pasteurii DSM 23907 = CRBIP 24.76]TDG77058.1 hypothetical protein C5L33_000701 [Lactobacillus pasteurii]CCI84802.1 N-acetylmuramidase [Lactobacillus pasteurii DSM 23907 = CRBIP 24.76]